MKILIAYDKNTSISNVLEKGVERAKADGAYVYLVRTCSADRKIEELSELEEQMNQIKNDVFDKEGIACETHLLIRGVAPGEDIVRYAKQKEVDEIIIGIKKRSKIGKMVFGSNAQYIILEAHCPVLTVK
ncbi:universal stress protein [Desulforhopalus singaporensis]|uniref:Nucleotide-binding universal stress protein, UspA family n=1 Tax=Desulforhopalus singaporensis TaxID=91360 RepID=A0A1H0KDU9_9BACT|nr:universal stress protein [Desulforhopalus singaporensis]SDO54105.1 Nucleotide-binding universal stress protein, UspA family [Desulforhopalus singaporensis]